MKNNWLYIAVIVGLVAVTVFLSETPPQNLIPLLDDRVEPDIVPYAVIENAHSRHFDTKGTLSYEFLAKTLNHYRIDLGTVSEGDFTSMDEPQLTLFADERVWYVTAEKGRLTNFGDVLTLWSNVRIWQAQIDEDNMELTTEKLVIMPRDKIVRTEEAVKITSTQGTLDAIGMVVDLNTEAIQLLQKVRGYHEPI